MFFCCASHCRAGAVFRSSHCLSRVCALRWRGFSPLEDVSTYMNPSSLLLSFPFCYPNCPYLMLLLQFSIYIIILSYSGLYQLKIYFLFYVYNTIQNPFSSFVLVKLVRQDCLYMLNYLPGEVYTCQLLASCSSSSITWMVSEEYFVYILYTQLVFILHAQLNERKRETSFYLGVATYNLWHTLRTNRSCLSLFGYYKPLLLCSLLSLVKG